MNDDRVGWASDRELFEAIVSQLEDPEDAHVRRAFWALGALFFLLGTVAVTVVGGLGWPGLAGFCTTFGASAVLAHRRLRRRRNRA